MRGKTMNEKYQYIFDELLKVNMKSANEIYYALTLLDTALSNSTSAFKDAVKEKLDSNKFVEAQQLIDCCTKTENLSDKINSILNYVSEQVVKSEIFTTKEEPQAKEHTAIDNVSPSDMSTTVPVDYSKYETNRYECHTLDEDFMHKKICAFELNGEYFNVSSWKHALITLCNWTLKNHYNELQSFVNNPDFQGKKNTYFMDKYVPERNKKIGNSSIYVWTNLSANDTVKLIKNILSHLGISHNEFIVYLRADYTELHS